MTKQSIYKLNDVVIDITDDCLKMNLSKKERRRSLFFLILMPLVAIGVFLWLSGMPRKKVDSLEMAVAGILLLVFVAVFYINGYIKTVKNLREIIFEKKPDIILINGKILCNRNEFNSIIVQPKISMYGFGEGCTVGIGYNKKATPISFNHRPKEALEIANVIAVFFNCVVVEKKSLLFSFFTKW